MLGAAQRAAGVSPKALGPAPPKIRQAAVRNAALRANLRPQPGQAQAAKLKLTVDLARLPVSAGGTLSQGPRLMLTGLQLKAQAHSNADFSPHR